MPFKLPVLVGKANINPSEYPHLHQDEYAELYNNWQSKMMSLQSAQQSLNRKVADHKNNMDRKFNSFSTTNLLFEDMPYKGSSEYNAVRLAIDTAKALIANPYGHGLLSQYYREDNLKIIERDTNITVTLNIEDTEGEPDVEVYEDELVLSEVS